MIAPPYRYRCICGFEVSGPDRPFVMDEYSTHLHYCHKKEKRIICDCSLKYCHGCVINGVDYAKLD